MRTPYKYVDRVSDLKKELGDSSPAQFSPLLVTLLEQLKFVSQESDRLYAAKWLRRYIRDSCTCGESWLVANCLLRESGYEGLSETEYQLGAAGHSLFDRILESKDVFALEAVSLRSEVAAVVFRTKHSNAEEAAHLLSLVPRKLTSVLIEPRILDQLVDAREPVQQAFLRGVRNLEPTPDEVKRLAAWTTAHRITFADALWVMPREDLVKVLELQNGEDVVVAAGAIRELNNRSEKVPTSLLTSVLNRFGSNKGLVREVSKAVEWSSLDIDEKQRRQFASYPLVLASLIKATRKISESEVSLINKLDDEDGLVEVVSALYQHTDYRDTELAERVAATCIRIKTGSALRLLATFASGGLLKDNTAATLDLVATSKGPETISEEFVSLCLSLYNSVGVSTELRTWFQRCMVWLTKNMSEESVLSSKVTGFASMFAHQVIEEDVDIWKLTGKNMLNAFIESAIQRFINVESVQYLVAALVFKASVRDIEAAKLAQMMLHQEALKEVNDVQALILWKLFSFDRKGLATQDSMRQVLAWFGGEKNPKDMILMDILKLIESESGFAWTNLVFSWVFRPIGFQDEYEKSPLFEKTRGGFDVTIDCNLIRDAVKTFDPDATSLTLDGSLHSALKSCTDFRRLFGDRAYADEFLLMTLISCSEIFRPQGVIDVKLLVESHGLGYVLRALSSHNENYRTVAKTVLTAVYNYLAPSDKEQEQEEKQKQKQEQEQESREVRSSESGYKERLSVRILIGKVLSFSEEQTLLPCYAFLLASILQVLARPNHFLHDKATEFLMSGPSLLPSEIPLFKAISRSTSETANRESLWLVQCLRFGLAAPEDVDFYFKRGIFEWAMVLNNLPRSTGLKEHVQKLIARCQELSKGSVSLITRNGALSWVDSLPDGDMRSKLGLRFAYTVDKEKLESWTQTPRGLVVDTFMS